METAHWDDSLTEFAPNPELTMGHCLTPFAFMIFSAAFAHNAHEKFEFSSMGGHASTAFY